MLRDRIRKSGKAYRNIPTILEPTFFPPFNIPFLFFTNRSSSGDKFRCTFLPFFVCSFHDSREPISSGREKTAKVTTLIASA